MMGRIEGAEAFCGRTAREPPQNRLFRMEVRTAWTQSKTLARQAFSP